MSREGETDEAEQKTHFRVDKSKCIRCGKCVNTCFGMVITFGKDGYPAEVLNELAPEAREMLDIPTDRYTDGKR